MKSVKYLMLMLAVFLVSCGNDTNEEAISIEDLLKEDYVTLTMNQSETPINSNREVNEGEQIKDFQSLIDGIALKKIEKTDFQRMDKEMRSSHLTFISSHLLTSKEEIEMNGLNFTFSENGQMVVINITENKGIDFYKGVETSPELFEKVQGYYENTVHQSEVEKIDF